MTKSMPLPASSLDNYKAQLKERGELAVLKKRVEDRIKELDAELRPALEGRGEIVAEGFSFKCVLTPGRKTLDKEALTAYFANTDYSLDEFEKEGAPFTTMTVKAVNVI